ncbi:type III-B CRISPR module-associated protein Cmr5 [uncultured Desulfobacter sp.]|uniref:type III-B CRISPR module-associated protein Cmr5 n=1 Tax=uncultured Desulfobacter sp. TaxID=240139 RepID=UPI002AAB2FD3|nr:type III-B CRISPR module-associated protein Cmr5 [uncultured Desulfobacter sp.]
MIQTLEQRRAAHALNCVNYRKEAGQKTYGKYVSYVSALPATILMNGLGQACATLLSQKETKGHKELYDDLQSWLCGDDVAAPYHNSDNTGTQQLMDNITTSDETKYFRARAEALAYLVWLKKLAKAFLEQGE